MKNYEYNISLNGEHFIFVGTRNNIGDEQAKEILDTLITKFPLEEGYNVYCDVTTKRTVRL